MKYFLSEIKYVANELFKKVTPSTKKIFNDIKKDGFSIVENYISEEQCDLLRAEFERLISEKYVWKDPLGSDSRIHSIEKVSPLFATLFTEDFLEEIYKKYIDSRNIDQFIMANKVSFIPNNSGSGGGWHRDVINRRQLKFICYLTDSNEQSGCTQYIPGTHTPTQKYKINSLLKKDLGAYRYKDEEIEELIQRDQKYAIKSFIAKKGTLLILDTSGLHRGRPLEEGTRYAATKYMSDTNFKQHITKLYAPKYDHK